MLATLRRIPPPAAAALAALLWLALAPPTPDLAAQAYRASLWARDGFLLYDSAWFGGHHLLGYSLLFPPLGALLGTKVVGLLAALVSAACFDRLVRHHFGARAWPGALWFGVATAADLMIGRVTYTLGVAFGLAALLALQRSRPRLAAALALGCAAASPVAGLFLALAGAATALGTRSRRGLEVAAPAFALCVAVAVAFPDGGTLTFNTLGVLSVVGLCVALLVVLPTDERVLRAGVALYAVCAVLAAVVPTPMGSNATRLAASFAGPLLLCVLVTRPQLVGRAARIATVGLAFAVAYQWYAPVRETAKGATDPSVEAAYFAPVKAFLAEQDGPPARVEVPFTRSHWEAVHLADDVPLARGWQTQLDRQRNPLFFSDEQVLDAGRYRDWLDRNAVRWVALPDAPLDPSGVAEARLIRREPSYLRLAEVTDHWRIYEVRDAAPMASGPAELLAVAPEAFTLDVRRPGRVLVRVRHSRWFSVLGRGCVERAGGGWTAVRARERGVLTVRAGLGRGTPCPR